MKTLLTFLFVLFFAASSLYAKEYQVTDILDGMKSAEKADSKRLKVGGGINQSRSTDVSYLAYDMTALVRFAAIVSGLFMLAIAFGQLSSNRENPTAYPFGRVIVVFLIAFALLLLAFIPSVYD